MFQLPVSTVISEPDCVTGILYKPDGFVHLSSIPSSWSMSSLRKLADLISSSVDAIEASCTQRGLSLPLLDEPYTPESDALYADPAVSQAATLICAAASQLSLLVRPAKMTLFLYGVEV